MKKRFLASLLAIGATLSGCNCIPPQPASGAFWLPEDARRPERSLRMALYDCAPYDPFRDAYLDRIAATPESDLYRYARGGAPAHAACMRALGWETAPGRLFGW